MIDYQTGRVTCDRCGEYLGNYLNDDYFKLIRQKYCPLCRTAADREQHRLAKRARAHHDRERKKLQAEQLELLKKENEILRRKVKEYDRL